MHEAQLYERRNDGKVTCHLCRHTCLIPPGGAGRCRVRVNRDGVLFSLVYGRLVAEHVDPVEKKPLFHLLPGSSSYSIATVGCNFSCLNCQNHTIAHFDVSAGNIPGEYRSPEEVVERALRAGCRSISYTYTEPTIFFEYACDVARLAGQAGLKNIFVTNGYITDEALDLIAPHLHAANIDLKGFTDEFYRHVTGAGLEGVLNGIRAYHARGIWIEITTLIIPGENDDRQQLEGIARFIADELGPHVPWHISRFFPQYRMSGHPVTPAGTIAEAASIGRSAGLHYVYEGNIAGGMEDTVCPECNAVVLQRHGFDVTASWLSAGRCGGCGVQLAGIWE